MACKLVPTKPFKLSADPRERDLANPLLLTSTAHVGSYDAVWVVDSDGEFARSLPYRTALPRPVVGDAGLVALAWHAQFERFGAPQVSRRFAKANKRPMTAHDWAAWMAGKARGRAAAAAAQGPELPRSPRRCRDARARRLEGQQPDAFRAWDGQLRQPLLLTDGQGVIATGADRRACCIRRTMLDTLGADAPEKLCKPKLNRTTSPAPHAAWPHALQALQRDRAGASCSSSSQQIRAA